MLNPVEIAPRGPRSALAIFGNHSVTTALNTMDICESYFPIRRLLSMYALSFVGVGFLLAVGFYGFETLIHLVEWLAARFSSRRKKDR